MWAHTDGREGRGEEAISKRRVGPQRRLQGRSFQVLNVPQYERAAAEMVRRGVRRDGGGLPSLTMINLQLYKVDLLPIWGTRSGYTKFRNWLSASFFGKYEARTRPKYSLLLLNDGELGVDICRRPWPVYRMQAS